GEEQRDTQLGRLATFGNAVFHEVAAAHDPEFAVYAGVDLWVMGRNCVRSRRDHNAFGSIRPRGTKGCAARVLGNHAGCVCDDSWLSCNAMACRAFWSPWRFGILLRSDDGFYRSDIRQGFLLRRGGLALVFCLSFLSGDRWSEFRCVYVVAAGAVSD